MKLPVFEAFNSFCKECGCVIITNRSYGGLCRDCYEKRIAKDTREEEEKAEIEREFFARKESQWDEDPYFQDIDKEIEDYDEYTD